MMVKMGSLLIEQPDLIWVAPLGAGFPGFEFKGLAPEERGKHIVDALVAMKNEKAAVLCEALTEKGKPIAGYGIPQKIEAEPTQAQAPVMYRFHVEVALER